MAAGLAEQSAPALHDTHPAARREMDSWRKELTR